jgi:hypothetical protein
MVTIDPEEAGQRAPSGRPKRLTGSRVFPFAEGRGEPGGQTEGSTGSRLFIPYYAGDDGKRSAEFQFPAEVNSAWCPSVKIYLPDGSLYTGGELPRGQTCNVVVEVANGGSAEAHAQVTVYWTEPSAGFGPPYLNGAPLVVGDNGSQGVPVYVPVGATVKAPSIRLMPSLSTPEHFCLIAVVDAPPDSPDGNWNPTLDAHYGQHNVYLEHVEPNGVQTFDFYAQNPFPDVEARVVVSLRPVDSGRTDALANIYQAEPREFDPGAMRLSTVGREFPPVPVRELQLDLRGGERQLCQGLLSAMGMEQGQFAAAEVLTTATPQQGVDQQARHGSLSVVIFAG